MSEAFCGKVKIVKEYSTSASNLFENHYLKWTPSFRFKMVDKKEVADEYSETYDS